MNQHPATQQPADRQQAEEDAAQFVGFKIDSQEYAFAIGKIQEIIVLDAVTPVPQVEDYVEGVTNLRGKIVPIISLRRLFGMPLAKENREARVIVLNVGDKTIGCRVDSVTQVLTISADAVEPAPELITGDVNQYLVGFANLDNRIVVMLNSDELLDPNKLESVRESALSALTSASPLAGAE